MALELKESVNKLSRLASVPGPARRGPIQPAIFYCLLVIFLPLLSIPAFIVLGTSTFFLHHGASVWVQSNDAVFDMQHRQCDVLVYGDSTAMTGVDPDLVEKQTGFKTCNIAVTNAVLAVTGNMTLDNYLQHNDRPKMLVVQLSPDDFQSENLIWQHTIYAEGLLELLRHSSPLDVRRTILEHPREAVSFAGYAAGYSAYYFLRETLYRTTGIRTDEDQVHVRNGFFTPPSPPRTYCDQDAKLKSTRSAFSRELADEYRRRYSGQNSVVLVDVAPIPSCDNNLNAYQKQLYGVTSNSLQPLPIGFFNDGRHYTATGASVVSTLLAKQVNEVAIANPVLDSRMPSASLTAALQPVSQHK